MRRHGHALILDEVKAGLSRTGSLFAFETSDIRPDIVTLGKSLGGGLPISAAVGPEAVLDVAPASAPLTNAGAPICAAAAEGCPRSCHRSGPRRGGRLTRIPCP
ncbi:aminotransferase class III-fold pyridoxal phosphate-dependent enzyme [Brevibacterium casei]|nr:aminotransferase class III-fold pyridoxal phosphate-dependent enzyme [Brevibacterium casei]